MGPDELQGHVVHKIGVESHQESNGHGPRHVPHVLHVLTHAFVIPNPFELKTSVRGKNGVKFHWESSEHGSRHVVLHVFDKSLAGIDGSALNQESSVGLLLVLRWSSVGLALVFR